MSQNLQAELERCDREIAEAQAGIAFDEGALLGARDWVQERRLIEAKLKKQQDKEASNQ